MKMTRLNLVLALVPTLMGLGLPRAQADPDPLGINPNSERYYRYPSIAFNADGLPVIAYEDAQLGATVTACENDSCQLASSRVVDPEGSANTAGTYSRLLIPVDDRPFIVHARQGSGGGLRAVKCELADCISGMIGDQIVGLGGASFSPVDIDATLGSDGLPVISVFQQSNLLITGLWVIRCEDDSCSSNTAVPIEAAGPLSGRTSSIAIGSTGFPLIAYRDRETSTSNGTLMLMACNDPACEGGDESFNAFGNLGGSTDRTVDLTVNDQGFPVITFVNPDNDLTVVTCNDPICAGNDEQVHMISMPTSAGFAMAMQLAADGTPIIATHGFDTVDESLLVVDCNDALCADDDEAIFTVFDSADPDIEFGRYLDMAIGADGLPAIVYSREDEAPMANVDSLRLVRCPVDDCVSVFADGFEQLP